MWQTKTSSVSPETTLPLTCRISRVGLLSNLLGRNAYGLCTEVTERFRLIQQDDMDSPLIRRFGHRILVTGFSATANWTPAAQNLVFVLHFTQADQVGNSSSTGSQNRLPILFNLSFNKDKLILWDYIGKNS